MSEHEISWTVHKIDTGEQLICAFKNRSRTSWKNLSKYEISPIKQFTRSTRRYSVSVYRSFHLSCAWGSLTLPVLPGFCCCFLITLPVSSVLCSWGTVQHQKKKKKRIDALSSNLKTNSLIKVQMETLSCVYKTNITGVQNRVKTAEAKSSGKLP